MRLVAPGFLLVALITLLALALYMVLTLRVARMRGVQRIATPGTAGPPEFARALRIQANTLEQLVPFVIAMWLCALYLQPLVAALGGTIWLVGRLLYAFVYAADPDKRSLPFAISTLATIGLIIGALAGVVLAYLRWP
jgi:glutathione S-transferase